MQAVIMAGGEGTRLRPLTCDIPKPMARLCGRPVMEYILDLLDTHGVTEAAVTLRYLPNVVTGHFGDMYKNVRLSFVTEDKPLGTAGGVRGAVDGLEGDDELLIISGDALTDFDLTAAAAFHREKNAAVTLVVTRVEDPREYGLVQSGADGRITGFVEKPGWSQATSDLANTGIYILSPAALEQIPPDQPFDFAKDLFPLLLEQGQPLYAYEAEGYWCDIGSLATYLSCQADMLEGRVKGVRPLSRTQPDGPYAIVPPVYIGQNVTIGEGARIGPDVVLDDGCRVGAGAKVRQSVLLDSAYAGERTAVNGAVLCHGASVRRGASLFEGAVVGAGALVGEYATVFPDAKVWPNKQVEPSAVLRDNLRDGGGWVMTFDETGLTGETGVELTPELCARVGAAIGSAVGRGGSKSGPDKIAVGYSGDPAGQALARALTSGLLATGRPVWDFGPCIQSQFDFFVSFSRLRAGVFLEGGAKSSIRLVVEGGLPASRPLERDVETRLVTGDFLRVGWEEIGEPTDMSGMNQLYRQELVSMAPLGLLGLEATVRGSDYEPVRLLESVLGTIGCEPGGDMRLYLGAGGRRLSIYDPEAGYVWPEQTTALSCLIALEQGQDIAVPYEAPAALERIAEQYGRRVTRYFNCPAGDTDASARRLAAGQLWARDGLMTAVRILYYMKTTRCTLAEMVARLPEFAVATKTVGCAANPGRVLQQFAAQGSGKPGEGARIETETGVLHVRPSKRGKSLILTAEAGDAETAAELCGDLEQRLEALLSGMGQA